MSATREYGIYGNRQDEFAYLTNETKADVVSYNHAYALMMHTAREAVKPADAPYVGMPATINLYTDSMAAVVVRVNPKSVTVARVATDPKSERRINAEGEPFPCVAVDGILTEVIGTPERYSRVVTSDGSVRYRNGSISVTLGRSVSVTDYRH